MARGKILLLAGIVVFAIAASVGGTVGVMAVLPGHDNKPAKPIAVPPKPLYFAELTDVVVSVPADAGDPASSFVQFAVQFSTYDQNAVTTFANLQPIVKSEVIGLLMNETGKSLQDPAMRATLANNCLKISNDVLAHSANYTPKNPFTAAYITNLVVQN